MIVHPLVSLAVPACLLVCGAAWSRALARDPRQHDLAAVVLAAWAWFAVLCVGVHLLGGTLRGLEFAIAGSTVVALSAWRWLPARVPFWPQLPAPGLHLGAAALVGAAIPAMAWVRGTPAVSLLGDDLAHTAHILEILRTGLPFPGSDFYPDLQATGIDPRFGVGHVGYALVLAPWAHRIADAWLWLAIPAGAGLAASFVVFLSRWIKGRGALALAIALQLAFYGGDRFPISTFAMYPMWVGMGLLHLALARLVDDDGNPLPWWHDAGVLGAAISLVLLHYFPAIAFLLAASLVLLVPPVIRALRMRLLWLVGLGCALLPGLAFRVAVSYESVNPIHREPWLSLSLGGPWRIVQPLPAMLTLSMLWIPAAWIAIRWLRRGRGAQRWLAWMILVPPFLALFPPTATLGMAVISFLLFRSLLLAPSAAVCGLALESAPAWLRSTPLRATAFVALALLAVVRLSQQWQTPELAYAGDFRTAVESGRRFLDEDDAVLADPYVSLALTGATGARVVVVPDGRSSPRDERAVARFLAAGRALAVDANARERWDAARSIGATHLWLHHTWDRAWSGYFFAVRPGGPGRIADQLHQLPESFPLVHEADGYSLFQIGSIPPTAEGPVPEWPVPDGEITLGPLAVSKVTVTPSMVFPGDELAVSMTWARRGDYPEIPYFVGYLRLDHASEVGGSKPLRKLQERIGHRVHRKTLRFEPGGDLRPAYLWAKGEALRETLTLRLPENLVPGPYVVRLLVEPGVRSREIRLSDYFRDLDSFSGVPIATVEVVDVP